MTNYRKLGPVPENFRRIGSLAGCPATESCDIGEASLDGKIVHTTWGRNLVKEQADWYARNTYYEPVLTGHVWETLEKTIDVGGKEVVVPAGKRENFELIFPQEVADKLLGILIA